MNIISKPAFESFQNQISDNFIVQERQMFSQITWSNFQEKDVAEHHIKYEYDVFNSFYWSKSKAISSLLPGTYWLSHNYYLYLEETIQHAYSNVRCYFQNIKKPKQLGFNII